MIHLTTIASAAFLLCFLRLLSFPNGTTAGFFSSSFSSQSDSRRPRDITSKEGLTSLYNSRVDSVEHVTRPLGGSGDSLGVKHSGVVVTTENGDRWLVHKGPGYGDSSDTVVTNAKHMSGDWKSGGSQPAQSGTKVADYVKAGGENYNLLFDNCHDGSKRMMDVGKENR
ncbi:uncharacterized protein [Montipora capricornis]|uniref:uncharacterized protein n=1 Tax=Montipora capricornis TaxID=246305 RepID=UPI0035F213E4